MGKNRKYFHSLTGLKAVMCLIIVFHHTLPETPLFDAIPLSSLIRYVGGSLGNSVFFMISGFLMVNAYRDRIQDGTVAFGPFLYSKISKFYPIYLLTNFIAVFFTRIFSYGLSGVTAETIAMVLLMQEKGFLRSGYPFNGTSWFINMLLACNIVFFGVCYLAKNRTAYRCMLAGVIMWGYVAMTHGYELPLLHQFMGVGLVNFFLGCAIAEVYPCLSDRQHRWFRPLSLLGLALIGVLMVINGVDNALGHQYVGLAFGVSPLILYAALEIPLLKRILSCGALKCLAKISMSVFFWHMVVHNVLFWVLPHFVKGEINQDLWFAIYLALAMVVSILSYKYLENGLFRKKTGKPQ